MRVLIETRLTPRADFHLEKLPPLGACSLHSGGALRAHSDMQPRPERGRLLAGAWAAMPPRGTGAFEGTAIRGMHTSACMLATRAVPAVSAAFCGGASPACLATVCVLETTLAVVARSTKRTQRCESVVRGYPSHAQLQYCLSCTSLQVLLMMSIRRMLHLSRC